MTPCICPNCGLNLRRLEDFDLGELHISGEFGMVSWKGQVPHLTKTERTIVLALAMAKGRIISREALYAVAGFDDVDNPNNQLSQYTKRIRDAFRDVDSAFDQIETERGIGLRWKYDQPMGAVLCEG